MLLPLLKCSLQSFPSFTQPTSVLVHFLHNTHLPNTLSSPLLLHPTYSRISLYLLTFSLWSIHTDNIKHHPFHFQLQTHDSVWHSSPTTLIMYSSFKITPGLATILLSIISANYPPFLGTVFTFRVSTLIAILMPFLLFGWHVLTCLPLSCSFILGQQFPLGPFLLTAPDEVAVNPGPDWFGVEISLFMIFMSDLTKIKIKMPFLAQYSPFIRAWDRP